MSFEIQTTNYFDAEAKRLAKRHSSFVDDLQDLRDNLLKNPYQGTELSPGIRKVRLTISSKGRGKSGGARVITFTYLVNEKDGVVVLLLLYDLPVRGGREHGPGPVREGKKCPAHQL